MGAKIKKCKKKENRGELNGWTGNRQRNPTSEIQRDMIQQQDRPKELLYVVTPALTASLPCNTMTYNDILYVSLCMYHYVSIYIYVPLWSIMYLWFYMLPSGRRWASQGFRPSFGPNGQETHGDSMSLKSKSDLSKLCLSFAFCNIFHYFALLYRHCHPIYSTCPAYGGL